MISYLSQNVKSNPYVLPVDINLMGKVLQFKEANFKANAAKVQEQINSVQNTDLIKDEDKEYLTTKLNNLVENINGMGGVDLGDINVANQLGQMTSNIYSDNDLLESITSTQKVRKLQATYEKMQTDPKLKGTFATQNFAYDMQGVNAWLNDGKRTTADNGYKGTSTPTTYTDLDKAAVEASKLIKAQYTKSTTKDGIYIHNTTKEEVTADDVKNEVKNRLMQDPMLQTQAKINSWYLRPGVTGDALKSEYVSKLTNTQLRLKTDLDEYKKNYDLATTEQKLQMEPYLKIKQDNFNSFTSSLDKINKTDLKHFEENKDSYRTELYVDEIADHMANTFSFTKFTDDVKPDLAAAAFLKNQLTAKDNGFLIVPDPTQPSGFSVVNDPNYIDRSGTKGKSGSGSGSGNPNNTDGFNILVDGQLMKGTNRENKEVHTDESVTKTILSKQDEKQTIFQDVIKDLLNQNPDLAKLYGKEQSQALLAEQFGKLNDPERFEIEDLKNATSKYMTPAQTEYISKLWKSFEAIKEGKDPIISMTPTQIDKMSQIHKINTEIEFMTDVRNRAMGLKDNMTIAEKSAISNATAHPDVFKPKVYSRRSEARLDSPVDVYKNAILGNQGNIYGTVGEIIAKNVYNAGAQINRRLANVSGSFTKKNILSVIEKDGKFIPADGKDHTYNFIGSGTKDQQVKNNSTQIKIPKEGVAKDVVLNYLKPYDKAGDISDDLQEIHILDTKEKIDYYTATEKTLNPKLAVKDPKAYEILDKVNGYYNYALPPDGGSQEKDGTLSKIKWGIIQEHKNQSNSIKMGDGREVPSEFNIDGFDLDKSYISRVGSSTSDPFKLEVEVSLMNKASGSKKASVGQTIKRDLTVDEARQLGIEMPPRETIIDKAMIDYYGRTKPQVYQSKVKPTSLAVEMEIFAQNGGTYYPQIRIPVNGKMELITLTGSTKGLPELGAETPQQVRAMFQSFIDGIAQYHGIENNEQLYALIKQLMNGK